MAKNPPAVFHWLF